jgi:nicotinamide riboside kinase
MPIAAPSGIANAYYFGMRDGIAILDAKIVTTSDYSAIAISQHCPNGQPAFIESHFGFAESFPQ